MRKETKVILDEFVDYCEQDHGLFVPSWMIDGFLTTQKLCKHGQQIKGCIRWADTCFDCKNERNQLTQTL